MKTLTGFIPICASCKNIRDDAGYWQQIEQYLCKHSDLEFTHGICPACLEKLYPEFAARQRDGWRSKRLGFPDCRLAWLAYRPAMYWTDAIAAVASPFGEGAIALLRLSGPRVRWRPCRPGLPGTTWQKAVGVRSETPGTRETPAN